MRHYSQAFIPGKPAAPPCLSSYYFSMISMQDAIALPACTLAQ